MRRRAVRRFVVEHPSLFAIGIQGGTTSPLVRAAAGVALDVLKERVARLAEADLLGGRTVDDATLAFHALCEGLAVIELRGSCHDGARTWGQALDALISGFARPATPPV